nr:pentapeptide repeat-containing protein [uncultured Cohaesibacter sp.]
MLNKIKAMARTVKESTVSRDSNIGNYAILLVKRLYFLVSNYWGWPVSFVWIGAVGFIILQPQIAQDWDKIDTIAQWKQLTGGTTDPSSMLRNLGWLLITAVGLPLLIWRTFVAAKQAKTGIKRTEQVANQLELTRQGQSADRYVKAAAMLSDEKISVREAGIFALRQLAISDPDEYYFPVQDLFCSFMRAEGMRSRLEAGNEEQPVRCKPCDSDVISALRAFSELRTVQNMEREEARDWEPNLRQCNFNRLPEHRKMINLEGANLQGTQFQMAFLMFANLQKAFLFQAELQDADLFHAQLQGADFTDAKLQSCDLMSTQLQGAELRNTCLDKGQLDKSADLTDAKFSLPIWPKENWPKGWQPSGILEDEWGGQEYFTFIRTEVRDEE